MDVLPGRSVHEWMHTTHLPWSVIWAMVDQVARGPRALARARRHPRRPQALQRDARPGVERARAARVPARPRAWPGCASTGTTRGSTARARRRSPSTPAPERWAGSRPSRSGARRRSSVRRPISTRSGCVMYRVLSGKEIFEGNAQDVLRAHKRTAVPPPTLPEEVPPEAGKFVLRLLEKKPWNRFEFAGDARRAWMRLKPPQASTLEETVQSAPSSRTFPATYAKSLAPGILSLRAPMLVARQDERSELWSAVEAVAAGNPRQELIALIGEAGVGKSRLAEWLCAEVHERGDDAAAPRPLRPHPDAARRHHGRHQRPLRPRGRRPGCGRAGADDALGGGQGRRRRPHLGRRDRRVAPSHAAGRARLARSDGQALRARPARAALRRHQAHARAPLARPPGAAVARRSALRLAQHVRDAVAPQARRGEPAAAPRRHRAQRDARDRSGRGAAHGGDARRVERQGARAQAPGHRRHRGPAPHGPPAHRRRRPARHRAEPRQPAVRAAAALRLGGRRLPHARGRSVRRAPDARCRGAPSPPPSCGTSACAPSPPSCA